MDNQVFDRYLSTNQNTLKKGKFMRDYEQTLINLCCLNDTDIPPFLYQDYINWNFSTVYRCTILPHKYDYRAKQINLAPVKQGTCVIRLDFREPLPSEDLYEMFILSFRPSTIEISNNRHVTTSYFK